MPINMDHRQNIIVTDDGLLDFNMTGGISIPVGTTGQRPGSPIAGQMRYNSSLGKFEGYTSTWDTIGGAVPVQDDGVSVVAEPTAFNFTGLAVSVTNVGGVATVNVPGNTTSVTPIIRDSAVTWKDGLTTTCPIPGTAVAGDLMIIVATGAWSPIPPAGWTTLVILTQNNHLGRAMSKVLDAGDITATEVSITWSGNFEHTYSVVVFEGEWSVGGAEVTGTTSTVASLNQPVTIREIGNKAILVGANRASNSNNDADIGTEIATGGSTNASSAIYELTETAGGAFSYNWTYSVSGAASSWYISIDPTVTSGVAVGDLYDADTTSTPPATGDALIWNGAAWVPDNAVTLNTTKLDGIATGANLYVHPSDGVDPGAALTGANVFSDITVNAAGHVTGSTTRAITGSDIGINKAYVDALNVDADTIDSLNSSAFVRSDIDDFVGGVLSFNSTFSLNTAALQISTLAQTTLTSFNKGVYGCGKFLIQATDTITSELHITELLVVHDGTTASATEYGIIHTGASPLATYDVSVSGNDILVLATSASASFTDYKVTEILVFGYSAGP